MNRSHWLLPGLALALSLPGCNDSVTGFLGCGIDVCSAREQCAETAIGPTCVCAEGFTGDGCRDCASGYERINANQCDLIPIDCDDDASVCGAHGACVERSSGDACECDDLYTGRLCELCESGYQDNDADGSCRATCLEADLDCKSPSRCSDARGTAVCECPVGYTGDDCSLCALGYRDSGTACVPTCAASATSCSRGQVCVDSPSGARCECAEGHAGARCESCAEGYREDPSTGSCLPSCDGAAAACGEHGHCDDSAGFARCVCDLGHAGLDCQQCADEFDAGAGGQCQRTLNSAQTLVLPARYQSRPVLATLDPTTGESLPLVELSASGLASGAEPRTLFLNQAGSITQLTLPGQSRDVLVPSSGAAGPLVWDAEASRIYALSGKPPFSLLSIDPVTKVVVELFATNLAGVADLALDRARGRLLAVRDGLYGIELSDGAVGELGVLPPATLGIEVGSDGSVLALAATDADEAESRVQACRATAARLMLPGYSSATGRFIQPAAGVDEVMLVESAASDSPEVLSYLGRGTSAPPRTVEVQVQNAEAVVCLALEEATRIQVAARTRFRALVVYAADAEVELAFETDVAADPRIFLGGYAPNFTYPARGDVVAYTPQEWLALRLPVDMRFHQPGPGVLYTLGEELEVVESTPLVGAAIPSGPLSFWTPVAP